MKILLTIAFDGTAYRGYQVQKNGPTVQAALNAAAQELFGFACDAVGCSRTDSGVHAKMFCVAISKRGEGSLETDIPVGKIPDAMNAHLPEDISVLSAEWVPESFHPRYDVASKEYVYRIYNGRYRSPFESRCSCFFPQHLDEGLMNDACRYFLGSHDFTSFMAAGSKIEDATRNVFEASVKRDGDIILFRVRANGFLYNMVRIMAGTLILAGTGKIRPEEVAVIIAAKDRKLAGKTMPPEGLYLNDVRYGVSHQG